MNTLSLFALSAGYLLIGIFIGSILADVDDFGYWLAVMFWPIVIACLILFGLIAIPMWAGKKIRDLLDL